MKNTTALMNSALAAIVALGSFGLSDDALAPVPKDREKPDGFSKTQTPIPEVGDRS